MFRALGGARKRQETVAGRACYHGGMERCPWCGSDPLYVKYHDREWGTPVHDEMKHFEYLLLETQQAGLSWITVLRKREAYRRAFAGFDPRIVASFGQGEIEALVRDEGIIRNRRKIEAAVNNAKAFLKIQRESGSFDTWLWGFVGGKPVVGGWSSIAEIPATTALSDKVSAAMKAAGFSFVGSTTIYAHLQAVGVVNDHLVSCYRWKELCG